MSRVVDQKVVEMQFDNRHFEKNVSKTMTTLEKLKQSLKLPDASKSLEGINRSAKNVNLSTISNAVETVQTKFSALQVAGVTALANITNSAVNAGKRIVKSLTIDPVTTGFQEYELKMGSIQTIMAGTGESLDRVNQKLNELNKYSDDTIYSFKDMTDNIGKFTNAGVGLDDAVDAIKGISNVAAISGANANEASRAMYNFSQALSAGYVQLVDWKSIELANMGTAEFRKQLLESAVAAKQLTRVSEGLYKTLDGNEVTVETFRNTLQDKWLTSDVLIRTLKDYASGTTDIGKRATAAATEVKTFSMMMDTLKESVQSGWAQTWEILVGDFEEAKSLFTTMSNAIGGFIGKISDTRNDILKGALASPWETLSEQISDAGIDLDDFKDSLKKTAKEHNKELAKMSDEELTFDKMLEDGIVTKELVIKTLNDYVSNLDGVSESTADMSDKLKYFQKVVDRVWNGDYKNGKERIEALTEAGYNYAEVQALVNKTVDGHRLTLEDLSDEQLRSIGYTDEQIEAIKQLAEEAKMAGTPLNELLDRMTEKSGRELLLETFKKLLSELAKPFEAVKTAWDNTFGGSNMSGGLYDIIEAIHDFVAELEFSQKAVDNFATIMEGVFSVFQIGNMLFTMSLTGGIKIATAVLELFGTNLGEVLAMIAQYIINLRDWLKEHTIFIDQWSKIADVIYEVITGVERCARAFFDLLPISTIMSHLEGILVPLFGSIGEGLDSISVDQFCANIKAAFDAVEKWLQGLKGSETLGADLVEGLILGISKGIDIVVDVVVNLAKAIIDAFCGETEINSPSKVFMILGGFIVAGLARGILDGSIDVWDAISSVANKCIEIVKSMDIGHVLSIGAFAGMFLIAKKLLNIAEMFAAPAKGIGKMFTGIGSFFDGLGKKFAPAEVSKWTTISQAILKVALAIGVITAAFYILGTMEKDEMIRAATALAYMAVVLSALMLVAKLLDKMKSLGSSFLPVLGLAGGLLIMAFAFKQLADVNLDAVPAAIAAMGTMLAGLAIVIAAFGLFGDSAGNRYISRAGGLLIKMTAALLLMVGVIKAISLLSPDEIDKGIALIRKVLEMFAAIMIVASLTGKYASKAGTMILKMSMALLVMVGVIKVAALLDPTDVENGIAVIKKVGILFAILIGVSALAGNNAGKAGGMILAMSAAFMITVFVIKQAAALDANTVEQGIYVLQRVAMLFGALMIVSEFAGNNAVKAGVMLLLVSGAMLILTGVIHLLGKMKPNEIKQGLIAVGVLSVLFGALIAVTSMAKNCTATLIIITVALSILAAALAALTMVDPEKLMGAAAAMSMVMGMLAVVIASTETSKEAVKTLIVISVAIGILGAILYLLGGLPVESTLASAVSLAILMIALAAVLKITEGLQGPSTKALVAMAIVTGVVVALAFALDLLRGLNPAQGTAIALILALFVTALVGVVALMGLLTGPSVGALVALGIVTLVVIAIAGVLYALQDLDPNQALGIVLVISAFLAAMVVVCVAAAGIGALAQYAIPGLIILVAFIGILGLVIIGLAELALDVLSRMPQVGTDLSEFMKNVQPFIDGVENIPDNISDKIGTLCSAILKLSGTDLLNAITTFLSGGHDLADLGNELKAFGEGMNTFNSGLVNIDTAVASMGKIKDIQSIVAETDLSGLSAISTSLVGYSTNVALVDYGAVDRSIFAIKRLAALVAELAGMDVDGITRSINALGNISVDKIISAFSTAEVNLTNVGSGMMNAIAKGFESKKDAIAQTAKGVSNNILMVISIDLPLFVLAGSRMMENITTGFTDGSENMKTEVGSALSSAASKVKEYYSDFYDAGDYLIDGVAAGIRANQYVAVAAAQSVAIAVENIIRSAWQVNSPSKLFYKIALGIGEGVVDGIVDSESDVRSSTNDFADRATKGFTRALAAVNRVIDDGLDANPTIRPVLDLSNVESGVGTLNGLLGDSSIGLNSHIGAISTMMNRRSQNGVNGDVVSAIDKLRGDLGRVGNTYNNINGITYDDGSNVSEAIGVLVRAALIERRT